MALASYLHKYFWDIDASQATPKKHPEYYIERLLELGNTKAIGWAKRVYGVDKIIKVARKSRRLSQKSRTYWLLVLK